MTKNLRQIMELLSLSNFLKKEERVEFLTFFALVADDQLGPIIQLLKKFPEQSRMILENIRAKKKAAKAKDPVAWEKIFVEETKI